MEDIKKPTKNTEEVEQNASLETSAEEIENETKEPERNFEEENILLKEQILRALAEVENTQKRVQREKEEIQKYAVTNFGRDLLTILDTLDRALESIPQDSREKEGLFKTIFQGVALTKDELMKVFHKNHIKSINPKGEKFDPTYHQAVVEVETSDYPSGQVVEVFQTGYLINNRLLRPAMVSVSKGK